MNRPSAFGVMVDDPRARRRGRGRFTLLNWGVWTLFGALQAATWLASPIGDPYPNALPLFGIALFNAYLWALLTPFIFRLAAYVNRGDAPKVRLAISVIVLGIVLAAVVAVVAASVHGGLPWGAASPEQERHAFWALGRWYVEEIVLFFLVFGMGIAADLFRKYQAREREALRLKEQATRLEAERAELNARLAEARLAVLRSQLNPHFLFNTLNAVSALVATDPAGVRDMIALLSDLLRFALTEGEEEEISVTREIEQLRLYLEILEIRYQGQLKTEVTVEPGAQAALLPRMILQPLVENALKHGVAPGGGSGRIAVHAARIGDDLVVTVQDSGAGVSSADATEGYGVGLRVTRERLHELYGDDQKLELFTAVGGGTVAQIAVPYHTTADLHVAVESK